MCKYYELCTFITLCKCTKNLGDHIIFSIIKSITDDENST